MKSQLFLTVGSIDSIAQSNSQNCFGRKFFSLQSGDDKRDENICADSMIQRNVFQAIFVERTIQSNNLISNFIAAAKVTFAISFRASRLSKQFLTFVHSEFLS